MIPVVFINCRLFPFIDWILRHLKMFETRSRNTLRQLVGQRVILAETGRHGRPVARCLVTIGDPVVINRKKDFDIFRGATWIEEGSAYDWKPDTKRKYLYPLANVTPVDPFPVPEGVRHGRVWMELSLNDYMTEV